MAIRRWDPLRDLVRLQQNMNRMFEDALAQSSATVGSDGGGGGAWQPPMDLFEESQRFVLRVDLPGIAASDVEGRGEAERLVLRGHRKADENVARDAYLRVERPSGTFALQVALPPSVDSGRIQASQRDGVLEVVLPKKTEELPGRIEVAGA